MINITVNMKEVKIGAMLHIMFILKTECIYIIMVAIGNSMIETKMVIVTTTEVAILQVVLILLQNLMAINGGVPVTMYISISIQYLMNHYLKVLLPK